MAADTGEQRSEGGRLGAGDLLRQALVDEQDPRFPWWLPLPGLLAALTWAGYQAATGAAGFLPTLLWPGLAVLAIVTAVAWFGWQLDID
jgi:hypothetical protein